VGDLPRRLPLHRVHLDTIADNARDIDFAMRWGFGWSVGPFETWQAAGWTQIAQWVKEDIDAGKALTDAPLPAWVFERKSPRRACTRLKVRTRPQEQLCAAFRPAVYERQQFRAPVVGAGGHDPKTAGTTVFEDDSVRLWHSATRCWSSR
jgi:3-hydroxyacyl-CoA dehydrogenase